jgi:hypothetical protein
VQKRNRRVAADDEEGTRWAFELSSERVHHHTVFPHRRLEQSQDS